LDFVFVDYMFLQPTGLSLIDFNAQEALLTFNTPTGEFGLAVSLYTLQKNESIYIK
jgi:hypothetical protein